MSRTFVVTSILLLGILLPHLPGRYDATAATISFVIQVGSYASLLFVPVGVLGTFAQRHTGWFRQLTIIVAGVSVFVTSIAAIAINNLALGLIIACGGIIAVRNINRRMALDSAAATGRRRLSSSFVAVVPILLVTFISTLLPRAAEWSRNRAIQHSATLVAEIELFRQRRGHYPLSLQSLNRDVPTGVVGLERFHYEPSGDAYNLFFIRSAVALDAMEVVMYNPRNEQRFTSHELDILQFDGEQLDLRRGDRRRTTLAQAGWVSILFD